MLAQQMQLANAMIPGAPLQPMVSLLVLYTTAFRPCSNVITPQTAMRLSAKALQQSELLAFQCQ